MTNLFEYRAVVSTVAAIALCSAAQAQDRRTVAKPVEPIDVCARLFPSSKNDTTRLQDAIDHCPTGAAVYLAGGAFRSGPLDMKSGVTIWIERNATLFAISVPSAYDKGSGTCGTIDDKGDGCRPFISFSNTYGGGIYGDGTIDGLGGAFAVGSIGPWWRLSRRAEIEGGRQNVPDLIQIDHAQNITFHGITLRNAPHFHVAMNRVVGATYWGITIDGPADIRNTDGIDADASQDVTITHSFIRTGDNNVALRASNKGPTRYISIIDNCFGWGRGMSIGSAVSSGVSDILVNGLTFDGSTSGLRITSDVSQGGLVEKVTYENIRLRDNRLPIIFDAKYDPNAQGDAIPVYRKIVLRHVRGDKGALLIRGLDQRHALDITLDDVRFADSASWQVENADVTVGTSGLSPPLQNRAGEPVPNTGTQRF